MKQLADLYIIYQLVRRLTTPFDKTPAYALGIIDAKGNVLRPRKELTTTKEKAAWTWLDIVLNNIKRFMSRLPGGNSRWFTYFMALYLLREPVQKLRESVNKTDIELWNEIIQTPALHTYLQESLALDEDAPATNAGSGAIAGIGVGPQGEPGVYGRKPQKFAGCKVFKIDNMTFQRCEAKLQEMSIMHESVVRRVSDIPSSGMIVINTTTGAALFLPTPR